MADTKKVSALADGLLNSTARAEEMRTYYVCIYKDIGIHIYTHSSFGRFDGSVSGYVGTLQASAWYILGLETR